MTVHDDAQAVLPQASLKTHAPKNNACSAHSRWMLWGILGFILMTILCLGFILWSQLQTHQQMRKQINQLHHNIDTLKKQQSALEAQTNTSIQTLSNTQEQLKNKTTALHKRIQATQQPHEGQTKSVLLLNARYHLELAQISARWYDNVQTTSMLLKQADALLATLSEPQIPPIREAIHQDLLALETDPGPNLMASINQLDAAQRILDTLPLKSTVTSSAVSTETSNQEPPTWRDRLRDSVSLLEKLVVIRHQEEDILPLPTPAYEALLRETIRLNLQEAQWALLQINPTIYHLSLAQAIQNITRSFDVHAERTETLLKSLQALQQIPFPSAKPRIEEPLRLLNQLMSVDSTSSSPITSDTRP